MWRFDLIVTVTVMMMHMYLHLGGRGYYYYVCVGFFFFSFSVCEHRCVADSQCQRHIIPWLHCLARYRRQALPSKKAPYSKKKKVELVLFLWMSDVARLDDLMS